MTEEGSVHITEAFMAGRPTKHGTQTLKVYEQTASLVRVLAFSYAQQINAVWDLLHHQCSLHETSVLHEGLRITSWIGLDQKTVMHLGFQSKPDDEVTFSCDVSNICII